MADEVVLKNARIVIADAVISGSVVLRDGRIARIDTGASQAGQDMGGDYLIPGLVELHTDHLEQHYAPRPGVRWNPVAALLAHDAQIAASGITTVFDALRCGMDNFADLTGKDMHALTVAIDQSASKGKLRAEHHIHLRCEVASPDCLDALQLFDGIERIQMASVMDHSPGQRQFASLDSYADYYKKKLKLTDEEFKRFCDHRIAESKKYSAPNRRAVAQYCRENDIVLASHDDATAEHVAEAVLDGVKVAEFPTTIEAARASKEAGMAVLMGAPNLVRGNSHSGNVSARELTRLGYLDILSSDYIPFSLLQAGFLLSEVDEGFSLPQAIALISKNPAQAVGLKDRGSIDIGLRADLVRVEHDDGVPVVRTVWREGRRVA